MSLLLRHTLRSIRKSVGQLIVILLTVTVVSVASFATFTLGGLFTNLQSSIISRLGLGSDISISDGVISDARLNEFLDDHPDEIEYVEKYFQTPGLFRPNGGEESKAIMVEATDLREFASRRGNELVIYDSYEYSYGYPEVWVGRSFAEENGLKPGDTVEIYAEEYASYRTLCVTYIFENHGFFANSIVNNLLVDFSAVGAEGLYTVVNIKLKDPSEKEAFVAELNERFPGVEVGDSVDMERVNRVVGSNQRLLNIALIFVIALMIFILLTAYLVVANRRAAEFSVFRAVGATGGQIALMLILEGLIYGFVGGVVGAVVGRMAMGLAVSKVIPNFPDAVTYSFTDYLFTVLMGMAVSVVGATVPIIRLMRESVRKSTQGRDRAVKKERRLPLIISGVIAIGLSVAAGITRLPGLTVPAVFCGAVFAYFSIPYLLKGISFLTRGKGAFGLSGVSIKRNPMSRTLSVMVGFVIVFTFLVVEIINVIIGAVTPANARFNADYAIETLGAADMRTLRDDIAKVYGVKDAYVYFYDTFVWDLGDQMQEYTVYGADNAAAVGGLSDSIDEETLRRFAMELNPVIISYDLARRFDLKAGDEVELILGDEENIVGKLSNVFTVVGVDYETTADDKKMIIRNSSFMVDNLPYEAQSSMIFVNVENYVPRADLYKDLRDICEGKFCYILTMDDWAYATSVGIRGVGTLLRILQAAVSLVAILGVINLTLVTHYGRAREFNVFFATGLDKKGYVLLALGESLIISLAGAVVGIGLSMIVNVLLPVFAEIIDRFIVYSVFPWELAVIAAAGIVAYVGIYILSAASRKRRPIERNMP